ncbi:MAG: type I restriction endonuclease subunit R [Anaerolineae bacterium]|nr:type I restriction endonuclease subunit R [Anaerolineae bacterium]
MAFTESVVEQASLDWLHELDWNIAAGPETAPETLYAEREDFSQVVLERRLRDALARLNPHLPPEALQDAFNKLTRPAHPSLLANNRALHLMLVNGVTVEYAGDGRIVGDTARVLDFDHAVNNDWLAVNQFTIVENHHNRRPDIVLFVNGLPLAVIELKNAADEDATIWDAFKQLQTYKAQIPSLFVYNEALIISDGLDARIGTLTADKERFMPWRTMDGETIAPGSVSRLEVLLRGVLDRRRLLDLVRHFIVFEDDGAGTLVKKMAGYHQFHAVNVAVAETIRAVGLPARSAREEYGGYYARPQPGGEPGDRRVGVVWHTQGSGKSLTMVFYAGKLVLDPALQNPTLVVLTDRNDLDDQLFGTFSRCRDILRQTPKQAADREDLRKLLNVAAGGVVFTTIQKFLPDETSKVSANAVNLQSSSPKNLRGLSDRRNIIIIADEAHRSQYDFIDGFARHMRDALPNASFIGFTGTPISKTDANTRAVFGDYISVYDILRANLDGATVPIYYEGRLAKLELDASERPLLDKKFDEATEGEEVSHKEKLKSKWAALEAVVGADKRVHLIADDITQHWAQRLQAMDGKAMIVCMSRRICVDMFNALVALHPEWASDDDQKGALKVVMTGSASDPLEWQTHIRNKAAREAIAKRFKDPNDPLKIVIVRDMWLTGFDVPSLHTMYVDKPMQEHGLMQTIARVNRVFKDKPGGLIVDYLGLGEQLREAVALYTESGGQGDTTIDQTQAVAVMLEKYEITRGLFYGLNWSRWMDGTPAERLSLLPAAQEHILALEDGKTRLLQAVTELSQAFALAVPHPQAIAIRDDVGFFQAVRSVVAKTTGESQRDTDALDHAIRQIVSRAVASDQVVDIFSAAGLKRPDISILSDEFLADVKNMPQRHLAIELLRKLLNDEIKTRSAKNLVQSRSFAEMLARSIRAYQNRALDTAQIIQELVGLAQEMREANKRGEELGLTEDELAFYDALEVNDSAVKVLGDDTLKTIARELVEAVRNNVTIDWTVRESARAKLRVMVRRLLRKHGYPPDKQDKATETVLEQAELIARDWAI